MSATIVTAVALATALLAAAPATAATIDKQGSTLVFVAGPKETNKLQFKVQSGPGGIQITDSGTQGEQDENDVTLTTSSFPTCLAGNGGLGANQAYCNMDGVKAIKVMLGDGSDSVSFEGDLGMAVTVSGGDGNDTIPGTPLADVLDGGAGDDTITSGAGNDTINAGDGNDIVHAGDGNDTIDGAAGNDVLEGEAGNDTVRGGAGNETKTDGTAAIDGGPGDDTLDGGPGADGIAGGDGTDTVSYADRTEPLNIDLNGNPDDGANGENDNIGTDVEVVVGGQGNDRIAGRDNSDEKTRNAPANDVLRGGPGDDTMFGRGGDDTIDGGAGKDLIDGGAGADSISGGADSDGVTYGARTTPVSISLDDQANDGNAGEGDNVASDVEELYGGAGDDTITGNDERNLIGGQGGNDTIYGRGGNDVVNGGEGDDTLHGGSGKDIVNYAWEGSPVSVSYDGQANDGAEGEHDNLASDIEGVIATTANDTLLGGPRRDFLYGYDGDDLLLGGPGPDMIVAGVGDDHIQSMDGVADFVSCGDGTDVALVDAKDSVAKDCETKVVGTAVSVITPAAGLRGLGSQLALPLSCQALILDGCAGTVRLTTLVTVQSKPPAKHKPAKGKASRRTKPKPKTKSLLIGLGSFAMAPGAEGTTNVTLTKLGASLLAKARKLSVTATAVNVDAAGSRSVATQTFILRAPAQKQTPKRPGSTRS